MVVVAIGGGAVDTGAVVVEGVINPVDGAMTGDADGTTSPASADERDQYPRPPTAAQPPISS